MLLWLGIDALRPLGQTHSLQETEVVILMGLQDK